MKNYIKVPDITKIKKMLNKVLIIMSLILGITCGVAIGIKLLYCIGIKLEMIMIAFCYLIMNESINELERAKLILCSSLIFLLTFYQKKGNIIMLKYFKLAIYKK